MEVSILGTTYEVIKLKYKDDSIFKERSLDGYCDGVLKRIVYCDMTTYPGFEQENKAFIERMEKEILRHEIIHAFFNESGLGQSSLVYRQGWSVNEEMVDWIALQAPKIFSVFTKLNIM